MLWNVLRALTICIASHVVAGQTQVPLVSSNSAQDMRSLSTITSESVFTKLTHESSSGYSVRVKKTEFCDPTVK